MKVRDEITAYASDEDKPILVWLFDRYHWESQWRFVAAYRWQRYGVESYKVNRVWVPTQEGRALYAYAQLQEGELT